MRTVVISVISISSMLFVIMIQSTINMEVRKKESLENAMSAALYQTMSEVVEQESYGICNANQMVAAFLQAMITRMDTDMDLTVNVHQVDYERGEMDVEAIGTYELPNHKNKTIIIRRKIAFVGNSDKIES
jgi:predicted RNA-binding protein Jag